ncbi:hypothetical protein L218DRAFT_1008815 [Marasmius fiardii PR-910]|nr:hypothetical protein L218DRAFT_1008815 [Marasmius fiardii PR-910]
MSQAQAQSSSDLVVNIFLYGAIPLFFYGINLVLFAVGMFLLKQRTQEKGISSHIVSAIVLFVFVTMAAVLTSLQVAVELGALSTLNLKKIG